MTDLLDFALEAHRRFDNWKGVTGVDLRLTLGGDLFAIKNIRMVFAPPSS